MKYLIAIALALGLLGVAAPAMADEAPPVVTAPDVNLLTTACQDQVVHVDNLGDSGQVFIWAPDPGDSQYYPNIGSGSVSLTLCGTKAVGTWAIEVARQETPGDPSSWRYYWSSFTTYKPTFDTVTASNSRSAGSSRARLSIRGTAMAGRPVAVRAKVSGHRARIVHRKTNAAGVVKMNCPKRHRCSYVFDYDNGYVTTSTRVH